MEMETEKHLTTGTSAAAGILATTALAVLDDDLTVAETPSAEPENIEASDEASGTITGKKPRVEAFTDRVALERAQSLLGDDYEPITIAMKSAPKKVSEKAYNALCYLADRGKLSKFTAIALGKLRAFETIKTEGFVSAFKEAGYSDKTARSQAQQQMVVLPMIHVAARTTDTLTLTPGHMLDLFAEAEVRIPGSTVTKTPKVSKSKVKPEDLLAEAAPEAPAPISVSADDVLAEPTQEEIMADTAAEIAAAELHREPDEAPARAKKKAKKSVKKAKKNGKKARK